MHRPLINFVCLAGILAATVLSVAACVDEHDAATETVARAAGVAENPSLFAGTGFAVTAPQALSLNRELTTLLVKHQAPGLPATVVDSYELARGLQEPVEFLRSESPIRAFVAAHPTADECLLITHIQDEVSGGVRDAIWRVTPAGRQPVDYLATPGLPAELPAEACYNLTPLYSWDGSCIVVPLGGLGVCVYHCQSDAWRFAPYPQLPGVPSGQSLGAVPDSGGGQLIYVSRWQIGHDGEWCQVNLLNLQSGEWVRNFQISAPGVPSRQWVIYNIAGADLVNEPWLVHGGRAPQDNTEKTRVPRIAKVDPLTGHVELLMFYGDPYWPVALDPLGRYVVYLDQQREAVVRLDTEDNVLEYDPRLTWQLSPGRELTPEEASQDRTHWYTADTKLFVSPGADVVCIWNDKEFIQAEFTEREELAELP